MGMFDTIRCDYPLPGDPPDWAVEFQTKDLDCLLEHFTIRSDGTLWNDTEDEFWNITDTIILYACSVHKKTGELVSFIEYSAVFINGEIESLVEIQGY